MRPWVQVFDQLTSMGSLYQQFYFWAVTLQEKALQAAAAGDPTASDVLSALEKTSSACEKGVLEHNVPLCAPAFHDLLVSGQHPLQQQLMCDYHSLSTVSSTRGTA